MTTTESGLDVERSQPQPRAIRPDRVTIGPSEDGYAVDVRWHGRDCILRAVVVRRLLVEAGYEAKPGNSQDGRIWELRVGPIPGDQVAKVVGTYIW